MSNNSVDVNIQLSYENPEVEIDLVNDVFFERSYNNLLDKPQINDITIIENHDGRYYKLANENDLMDGTLKSEYQVNPSNPATSKKYVDDMGHSIDDKLMIEPPQHKVTSENRATSKSYVDENIKIEEDERKTEDTAINEKFMSGETAVSKDNPATSKSYVDNKLMISPEIHKITDTNRAASTSYIDKKLMKNTEEEKYSVSDTNPATSKQYVDDNIAAEAKVRSDTDTSLTNKINTDIKAEKDARELEDTNINAKFMSGEKAVTSENPATSKSYVDSEITTEATARNNADTTLQSNIDAIINSKAQPNGIATLDNNGKVELSQIPDAILGQLTFGGTFNSEGIANISNALKYKLSITDNTIQLINSATDDKTTTPKQYGYKTLEGTYFIADANFDIGGIQFEVGDWLVSIGTAWKKIDNTDAVTGVKGDAEETYRIGNVNITKANIGLGNVDNTSDINKPISTATQTALTTEKTERTNADTALQTSITTHIGKKDNPHEVTKEQIGAIGDAESDDKEYARKNGAWVEVSGKVVSVNGKSGEVTLTYTDVNADAEGAAATVKTELTTEIDKKVDKVDGKGLSTNDYTTTEKQKLSDIEEEATKTTDAIVGGWGYTKNTGTVIKVSSGTGLAGGDITTTGTISHAEVAREDTTSSIEPAHKDNFTVIDTIETNALGHVTKVNTKTVTLPEGGGGGGSDGNQKLKVNGQTSFGANDEISLKAGSHVSLTQTNTETEKSISIAAKINTFEVNDAGLLTIGIEA